MQGGDLRESTVELLLYNREVLNTIKECENYSSDYHSIRTVSQKLINTKFKINGIEPGDYELVVQKDNCVVYKENILIKPGENYLDIANNIPNNHNGIKVIIDNYDEQKKYTVVLETKYGEQINQFRNKDKIEFYRSSGVIEINDLCPDNYRFIINEMTEKRFKVIEMEVDEDNKIYRVEV